MNILDKIVAERKKTLSQLKQVIPVGAWEMLPLFDKECLSLSKNLLDDNLTGIIAEFKRASPSKGVINDRSDIDDVVTGYQFHGAAGISILTEPVFFQGSNDDLLEAAGYLETPLLRKDFIIDEYQLYESKALGADVILLIAAILHPKEVKKLATIATGLGMEVLLELHDENELDHICDDATIIGINNRNLKTFQVDIERSLRMAEQIPSGKLMVAESGIDSIENILLFRNHGFKGFLIGEHFMKQPDPTIAFAEFVKQLKAKAHED